MDGSAFAVTGEDSVWLPCVAKLQMAASVSLDAALPDRCGGGGGTALLLARHSCGYPCRPEAWDVGSVGGSEIEAITFDTRCFNLAARTSRLDRLREEGINRQPMSASGAYKPPPTWEISLWVWSLFLALATGTIGIVYIVPGLITLVAGALVALALAFTGGTAIWLPLYYGTMFGSPIEYSFIPMSLNRIFALMLFVAFIWDCAVRRPNGRLTAPFVLWLIFTAWYLPMAYIKMPINGKPPVQTIFYITLTLTTFFFYQTRTRVVYLLNALMIMSVLTVLLPGVYETVRKLDVRPDGITGFINRIDGMALNSIYFAFTMIHLLPFIIFLLLQTKNPLLKISYQAYILIAVFLIMYTQNRQAPILLGAVLLVLLWLMRIRWKVLIASGLISLTLILGALTIGPILERFSKITQITRDDSLSERHDKFLIAMNMVDKNFWTGIGHGQFPVLWQKYKPVGGLKILNHRENREQYVDLGYVQILTEHGAIGLILFLAMISVTAVALARAYLKSLSFNDPWHTNYIAAFCASLTHLMISLLIQDTFNTPQFSLSFGLMFAALIMVKNENDRMQSARDSTIDGAVEKAPA